MQFGHVPVYRPAGAFRVVRQASFSPAPDGTHMCLCYTPVMKRSVQEIVELVVFGAIALLIGTGMLWVVGWIFSGLGWLFQAVSGLIWRLLIILVPIIVVAGLLYWLASYLMNRRGTGNVATVVPESPATSQGAAPDVSAATPADSPAAAAAATVTEVPAAPADPLGPADTAVVGTEPTHDTGPLAPAEAQPVADEAAPVSSLPGDTEAPAAPADPSLPVDEEATSPPADDDRPLRNG